MQKELTALELLRSQMTHINRNILENITEFFHNPDAALSDAHQQFTPEEMRRFVLSAPEFSNLIP